MIRLQIVEQPGSRLYRSLIGAMRSGELRTFIVGRRGRRVTHRNPSYSGWINWSSTAGVISCEILSPRKPGTEWRLLSALVGRLADKYTGQVHGISIQFPAALAAKRAAKRRRRPRR